MKYEIKRGEKKEYLTSSFHLIYNSGSQPLVVSDSQNEIVLNLEARL